MHRCHPESAVLRALMIGLLAAFALCGCNRPSEPVRGQFLVFGTEVEVLIRSDEGPRTQRALRELGELFQRLHRDWHPWQAGALKDLNRALSNGQSVTASPDLRLLIEVAQRYERASSGRFNAAIGGLIQLWGFHTSDYPIEAPAPEAAQIDHWLHRSPSALDIEIRGTQVHSMNPAVQLDFSGLAKGRASQLACDLLAALNLNDALINLGGDLMICGPAATAWRIAISDGQGGLFRTIEVERGPLAIFSSGTAQRWGEWQGARYAHLLDPRTGRALTHAIQATVIHPDPVLADAAATSLAIAGGDDWRQLAEDLHLDEVLLLDASGIMAMTDDFQARLAEQ